MADRCRQQPKPMPDLPVSWSFGRGSRATLVGLMPDGIGVRPQPDVEVVLRLPHRNLFAAECQEAFHVNRSRGLQVDGNGRYGRFCLQCARVGDVLTLEYADDLVEPAERCLRLGQADRNGELTDEGPLLWRKAGRRVVGCRFVCASGRDGRKTDAYGVQVDFDSSKQFGIKLVTAVAGTPKRLKDLLAKALG